MFPEYLLKLAIYVYVYYTWLYKHSSCELWFVSCTPRSQFLLGHPQEVILWYSGSSVHPPDTVGTHLDGSGSTCSPGKSLTLARQPARSITSSDADQASNYGGGCLQPCWKRLSIASPLTSHAAGRGVRRGLLVRSSIFSGRFWFGLVINMTRTTD